MMRINLTKFFLDSLIERRKSHVLRITRLIERIIPSDPRIILIPSSDLLPKPHSPVLMILVIPEGSIARRVIRMPVRILATRNGMHIQDSVNAVCSTLFVSVLASTKEKP
jgi:hypothetical protein